MTLRRAVKLDSVPEGYTLKCDGPGSLGRVERTPQGGIKVPANLTRSGVFEYSYNGKVVREYRAPEEVAKLVAGGTLESAPVTDDHPYQDAGNVNPSNFGRLAKGHGTGVKMDGDFATATLYIQDGALIQKIDSKEKSQVSLGLMSRDIVGPGFTPQGEAYDVRQTDLVANHIAIVAKARVAGSALKLDSSGLPARDETQKDNKTMRKIKIDGIEYPLGTEAEQAAAAQAMERYQAKVDSETSTLKAKADGLQGKLDAALEDAKGLKAKLDSATDPKAIEVMVAAKASLRETAVAVLGKDEAAKLDSDDSIRLAVVVKAYPHLKLDADVATKRPDYLQGLFDSAASKAKLDAVSQANGNVLATLNQPPHTEATPGTKQDADKRTPEEKMRDTNSKLASAPLAFTK